MKLLFLLFLFSLNLSAQKVICKKVKPSQSYDLSEKLHETSGLIKYNNRFWTHNDDTDCNLYALDTVSGEILETYNLPNVKNNDWEDIAQDETHFYIGDFGNNATGNRTGLHILKIEKASVLNRNPIIERIDFKYPNQTDFSVQKPNTTNFDCESMLVVGDSIFLFSKEWKTKKSTIYSLPKTAGSYFATEKNNIKIGFLVTSVCYIESKKSLVLCGYTKMGRPFVTVFSDFSGTNFFSGKSVKFKLKPRFQQIESIFSEDGFRYTITNEKLKFLWIKRQPKIFQIDLSTYFRN